MRKTAKDWSDYNEIWEGLAKGWASGNKCSRCKSSLFFYQERPDYNKGTYREEKACYLCNFMLESRTTDRPYDPIRQLIIRLPLAEMKTTSRQ